MSISAHELTYLLHHRRISTGSDSTASTTLKSLHDEDQPFLFDISFQKGKFRFEFYDTASPQSWQLLRPDVVVICYDISQRLSLIHVSKYVSPAFLSISFSSFPEDNHH